MDAKRELAILKEMTLRREQEALAQAAQSAKEAAEAKAAKEKAEKRAKAAKAKAEAEIASYKKRVADGQKKAQEEMKLSQEAAENAAKERERLEKEAREADQKEHEAEMAARRKRDAAMAARHAKEMAERKAQFEKVFRNIWGVGATGVSQIHMIAKDDETSKNVISNVFSDTLAADVFAHQKYIRTFKNETQLNKLISDLHNKEDRVLIEAVTQDDRVAELIEVAIKANGDDEMMPILVTPLA